MRQPSRPFLRGLAASGTTVALCDAFAHLDGRVMVKDRELFAGFGPLRETLLDPQSELDDGNPLTQPHGFVFDVPVDGQREPRPLEALGRFVPS